MMEDEYLQTQLQDVKVSFSRELPKSALFDLKRMEGVRRAEPILEIPVELTSGWREKTLLFVGVDPQADLLRVRDIEYRRIPIPKDGVILSKKVASDLGLAPGDRVRTEFLTRQKEIHEIPVRGVIQQYMGISGYVNIAYLAHMIREQRILSGALLQVDERRRDELVQRLKDLRAVATIQIREHFIRNFYASIGSYMNIMIGFLVGFAAIIAFSVIYNNAVVALAERQREMASLKVMGLGYPELMKILFHENFLLSALGILLGIPLGKFFCWILVDAYTSDLYRMPLVIYPETYALCAAATAFFVLLARLATRRRVRNLDMVEALKMRE